MKHVLTVLCLIGLCGLGACDKSLNDAELASIDNAVSNRLDAVAQSYQAGGLQAVVSHMSKIDEIQTELGMVQVTCNITADFYDPKDVVSQDVNETILPVSIYTSADAGVRFLDKGWKFRDATVTIIVRLTGQNIRTESHPLGLTQD